MLKILWSCNVVHFLSESRAPITDNVVQEKDNTLIAGMFTIMF